MKQLMVGLMLAVAFSGLAGCQKAKSSTRVSTGAGRSGGVQAGQTTTPSGVSLTAAVKTNSSQSDFELAIQDIIESILPRDYVGSVSSAATDGTGVFLGGRVTLANGGPISQVTNGNQSIASNSELLFVVFDSFYTKNGLDPIPPIYLKQATGTISGNYADIKFYDGYGFIRLVGQFDSNNFIAEVYYQTDKTYDGKASGWNGKLGVATIPKCSFFRCN